MGPILLIDKSVINGLSDNHWSLIHRFYSPVICPILMQELLADLAKPESLEEGKRLVAQLAGRTRGDSWVLPDARRLGIASLAGEKIPTNGQVPTFEGELVRNKRGEIVHIMGEPYEQKVLRRWQNQEFSVDEHEQAKFLRATSGLDFAPLQKKIRAAHKGQMKFANLASLVSWLDKEFIKKTPDQTHFFRITETLGISQSQALNFFDSWKKSGLRLAEFAPYAFYLYRTSLIFSFGVAFEKIPSSKDAKSHLDAEYLLYLPFSMAFASGDRRVHQLLVPFLLRDNQTFLYKDDLQKDLKAINSEWEQMKGSGSQTSRHGPPELKDSLTNQVWERNMGPPLQAEEKNTKISPEIEKKTVAELMDMSENTFRLSDGKRFKETKHYQAIRELTLAQRNIILLDLMEVAFSLKSGQSLDEIRRLFDAKKVKNFYNSYADVWPPDTDFLLMLKRDGKKSRAITYVDFSSEAVGQTINSLPLYFDEVLAPDPTHFPWNMKPEMNPIAHPEQFVEDTYKILLGILFAAPSISHGRLFLVPDIIDFNHDAREKLWASAKKRFFDVNIGERDKKASKRMMKRAYFHALTKLPDESLRMQIKKSDQSISESDVEAVMRHLRKKAASDLQNLPNHKIPSDGDLMVMRSGGNLEQMVLMSNLTKSMAVTESDTKVSEIHAVSCSQSSFHAPLKLTLPMFSSNEMFLLEVLREETPFDQFRKLFSEVLEWQYSGSKERLNSNLASDVINISREIFEAAPQIEKILQEEEDDDNFFAQYHGNLNIELRSLNEDFLKVARDCAKIVSPSTSIASTLLFGESVLREGFEPIDILN